MKKHSLSIEIIIFSAIFFLFVVPPLFAKNVFESNLFSVWNFPVNQLILAFFGGIILFFYYEKDKKKPFLIFFPVIYTFGLLFSGSLFIKYISILIGESPAIDIKMPSSFTGWLWCILNFSCAAFFEEVIYRFYIIDELEYLLKYKINIVCEIVGCLLFAFAHLYMGWISVLNAAIAHIILRMCYVKNHRLWQCVASHFIYNVISLILL
ncbi:CPBP family intramembrane glutamic endopeptidase [Treponema sp. Marseille-Q3903]|uniref:CPBP family intramembrane glutamic endopeptidase n=1 Tax=Treponema sp. Marseille-Q3903 TaxID=2766703 RepID=UPI001651DF9D|nr:type II CAAX endopeptidase family protein [Treponema sp. Marseille-Q3903]MBC6713622.1 CPBP family intramembrane metalloprotease [Treponema sp. Marseille-Q3903]